jgi:pre-mRNA-splicing factor CWC22
MRINLPHGLESELTTMIVECASQERTYEGFYGRIGERLSKINRLWRELFEEGFTNYYDTIHRFETNRLRIIAQFFAHLLSTEGIGLHVLMAVKLNEEDTTSSSRIFVKILFEEMMSSMGQKTLVERLKDPMLQDSLAGIFPTDDQAKTRFSINFFTAIGMGILTEGMREHLKNNVPKPQALPEPESDSESVSSRSSYSSYSSRSRSRSRSRSPARRRNRSASSDRSYSRSRSPAPRKVRGRTRSRSSSHSAASDSRSPPPRRRRYSSSRSRSPAPKKRARDSSRSLSRSLSPVRRRDASASRSRSPPRRRNDSVSRSPSPPPRRARDADSPPPRRARGSSSPPPRRAVKREYSSDPSVSPPPRRRREDDGEREAPTRRRRES